VRGLEQKSSLVLNPNWTDGINASVREVLFCNFEALKARIGAKRWDERIRLFFVENIGN